VFFATLQATHGVKGYFVLNVCKKKISIVNFLNYIQDNNVECREMQEWGNWPRPQIFDGVQPCG